VAKSKQNCGTGESIKAYGRRRGEMALALLRHKAEQRDSGLSVTMAFPPLAKGALRPFLPFRMPYFPDVSASRQNFRKLDH
jgi:hypothetical protein